MAQTIEDRVGAVVISGPREGEVVLLDPDIVSQAPSVEDVKFLSLNETLDNLNAVLDRLIAVLKARADDYAAAAKRMENGS